jgi:predicted TIM-barrel fold metal-dependent hydrolase
LIQRHPETTIIWAHTGAGRVVRPVQHHAEVLEAMLKDPAFGNLYFDISWDEVAKYFTSPEAIAVAADLINRYPDRFLFGTDAVAPHDRDEYLKTYRAYEGLWPRLTPEASHKVRIGNYERIFDTARKNVRTWERKQAK